MKTKTTYRMQGLFYAISGVGLFGLFTYRASLNNSAELIVGVLCLLAFIYQSYNSFTVID